MAVVAVGEDMPSGWWASVAARKQRADHGVVASVEAEASEAGSMDVWEHDTAEDSLAGKKDTIAEDSAGKEASWAPWAGSMQDSQDGESSEAEDVHIACHVFLGEAA